MSTKWRCTQCDWHGAHAKVLRAPNPFAEDDGETMMGCPECREPNVMRRACDEPGCWHEASSGTPTPEGYRWTCFDHRPALTTGKGAET